MFQKHSIMSLKKKSKSLGHLTALGSHPCSPDVEPKVQEQEQQHGNKSVIGDGAGITLVAERWQHKPCALQKRKTSWRYREGSNATSQKETFLPCQKDFPGEMQRWKAGRGMGQEEMGE